jgi:beta-glucanase (GH16 family)
LQSQSQSQLQENDYQLVWSEEFNADGKVDTALWRYEHGFVRNNEAQWYQEDNAFCRDGILIIEGRHEQVANPYYEPDNRDWRYNRKTAEYTSSSINTRGKKEFLYGRFEVRARIPTGGGSWPAIWTLGTKYPWPSNGEIDIMEYYRVKGVPHILANVAWGTDIPYNAKWDTGMIPFTHFTDKDPLWASKFHVWRMDWTPEAIRLYLDDEMLNETLLSETINGSIGEYTNPFQQTHYILLNLAIGGNNGGTPDNTAFPMRYEIDYVRVYQKKHTAFHPGEIWHDNRGEHINAHGGGVLFHNGKYYWFGEHKGERSNNALVGVTCYSSDDLYNWRYEDVALKVSDDETSDIVRGCIIERPKVIYNAKNKKFVMYFHLELRGQGYNAARVGIAVSDSITGGYKFVKSLRPNAGIFPLNMNEKQRKATAKIEDFKDWWTQEWRKAVDRKSVV